MEFTDDIKRLDRQIKLLQIKINEAISEEERIALRSVLKKAIRHKKGLQ